MRGIDFFPFNTNFFEDDKISLIEAEFGYKGSYVAVRLLCKIYNTEGYYCRWGRDECLLLSRKLGADFSSNLIDEVVKGLVRRSFFDKGVYDSFKILTSQGIQRRYLEAVKRRQEVFMRKELLLVDIRNYSNVRIDSDIGEQASLQKRPCTPKQGQTMTSDSDAVQLKRFYEIFFFRNFKDPKREAERFVSWNSMHDWTTESGKRLASTAQRASAAMLWKPGKESDIGRCPEWFIKAWKSLYKIASETDPQVASLFLDLGTNAASSATDVTITCKSAVVKWLENNIEKAAPILKPYLKGKKLMYAPKQ